MIQMETNDQHEIGRDPYAEPIGYPTLSALRRIADYSERQREKAAPDIIDLSANNGAQVPNTYSTKTGLRVMGFVVSGGTVGNKYSIRVGQRPYNFFFDGSTRFVLLPIDVQEGIDLSATDNTTPGSSNWQIYIYGYPAATI
jgi:hypothetical protein